MVGRAQVNGYEGLFIIRKEKFLTATIVSVQYYNIFVTSNEGHFRHARNCVHEIEGNFFKKIFELKKEG